MPSSNQKDKTIEIKATGRMQYNIDEVVPGRLYTKSLQILERV